MYINDRTGKIHAHTKKKSEKKNPIYYKRAGEKKTKCIRRRYRK
jgi:hypothetical protein